MPEYAANATNTSHNTTYTDEHGNRLKQYPYCTEEIKAEAIVCKHCKRDLQGKGSRSGVTPGRALVIALSGVLMLTGLAAPEAWGTTLPWIGFFIAESLAFVFLVISAVQGDF